MGETDFNLRRNRDENSRKCKSLSRYRERRRARLRGRGEETEVEDGIDALITGHTHKPVVSAPGKIKINHKGEIAVVPFKCITATSWLDYGGYAARKMLLPATHTLQTMTLKGKKKEITVTM